jgi:pre-mRNA-splicing factor SYF1
MPRIWLDYCEFLMKYQPYNVTFIRRTFDRALRALPITQHERIWELYLEFAQAVSGKTAITIYKRYIKVSDLIDYICL